jgi:hypothetical protein
MRYVLPVWYEIYLRTGFDEFDEFGEFDESAWKRSSNPGM